VQWIYLIFALRVDCAALINTKYTSLQIDYLVTGSYLHTCTEAQAYSVSKSKLNISETTVFDISRENRQHMVTIKMQAQLNYHSGREISMKYRDIHGVQLIVLTYLSRLYPKS
jgi:hypothetical protein